MGSVVVIPIFKKELEADEILSLRQCLKIFTTHPVVFSAPKALGLENYRKICKENHKDFLVERYNNRFFTSIQAYNKLMLSAQFYKRFEKYDYILIYQLDSYVFSNELDYWCNQGFDFIGAPWFEGKSESNENSNFMRYAGNGGFSLRRVKAIIEVLETRFKYVKRLNDLIEDYRSDRKIISILMMIFRRFRIKNLTYFFIKNFYLNEDRFFAFFAQKIVSEFRVATNKEAILFAFECQPRRLYKLTSGFLPFGCHAWRKNDEEFWRSFIEMPSSKER